ncbi:MAG: DUF6399 domain-containing protein [Chloroflexota bacterium]
MESARKVVKKEQTAQTKYLNQSRKPVGRPPEFEKRIAAAQAEVSQKQAELDSAIERKSQATDAIRGVSKCYHPYDLETGTPRDAETVAKSLDTHFDAMASIASDASLSERSVKNIQKARRVVTKMVATITFFFSTVQAHVQALTLTPKQEEALYNILIPAIYLQIVADKASTADERHTLQEHAQKLLQPLQQPSGPFASMGKDEKQIVESVATQCAHFFQRSSSCTEGRNGQLALRHHSLHRISTRKLAALTVVHNFFILRSDGSTPAKRFFEQDHHILFGYLLDHVDLPGRPAQKRPPPQTPPILS